MWLVTNCGVYCVGVRQKGQQLQQYDQWQKPEVRSNLGEDLTLNDPIKNSREVDSDRQQRTALWQRAHSKTTAIYCCV